MTTTIKLMRDETGTINVESTLEAAYTQLTELAATEESTSREVSAAVHAVFDTHLGKSIPMPAACALAQAAMGTDPSDYAETDKAIKTFIRNAPEFSVNKGKGGGVVRDADQPEKK